MAFHHRTQDAQRAGALSRGGRRAASDPPQKNLDPDALRRPRASNCPRPTRPMVMSLRAQPSSFVGLGLVESLRTSRLPDLATAIVAGVHFLQTAGTRMDASENVRDSDLEAII